MKLHLPLRYRVWHLVLLPVLLFMVPQVRMISGPLTGGSFVIIGAPSAGGVSSGGNYSIAGWLASSGAGTSTGQTFDLTCGLFGIYVVNSDGPLLKAERTTDKKARLWWDPYLTGYQLEYTTVLGPNAVWQAVSPQPINNSWTTDPVQPARYFRLHKP